MKTKAVNFSIGLAAQAWIDENCPGPTYIPGLISQSDDGWIVGWYSEDRVSAPAFPGFVATNGNGDQLVIVQSDSESRLENKVLSYGEGKFTLTAV